MKKLLRLFQAVRPTFEKGGKLGYFKPVFEALEHIFFAPSTTTMTAPHVRDPLDIKRLMSMVIIALVPCLIAALYFFGWRLIPMIIVSYAVGGALEVAFAIIRKEQINEGFLVTGMLFPLILPPALPLWMVGVGIAFGVLVGKELFGGTGRNIFNPAIVGRCFLVLAYPAATSGNWIKPGNEWAGRHGLSLCPLAQGKETVPWRDYVVAESQNARMLQTARFKYCIYDSGRHREQLIDLKNDPGEMENLVQNPDFNKVLDKHRRLLHEWIENH